MCDINVTVQWRKVPSDQATSALQFTRKTDVCDDHLERDKCYGESNAIRLTVNKYFQEPSDGIVPILVRYLANFYVSVVPQLQLWHL